MDKPLSDKDKTDKKQPEESKTSSKAAEGVALSGPAADFTQNTVGAYTQGPNQRIELSQEAWDKSANKGVPWRDDPKSRLAIRMFSRGVLGAAFFTAGGLLAKKAMSPVMEGKTLLRPGYDSLKGLHEQKNPLQFIAKLVDTVVSKPIEVTVNALGGNGTNAVRFRNTHFNRGKTWGRSLGEEVVMITFDFFSASVGDAWGRDIAGWFDPNVKKDWMDDKGHIKFPEAVKSAVHSMTRYVTYNGGEDWAVAIPYAFYMKAQRALINKASPGFKYDFDRGMNGAAFKLGTQKLDNGQEMHRIVGNYNKEGMIDLQGRFTVYNIGTLMFREAYDYVADRVAGKPTALYGSPDQFDAHKGTLGKMGDVVKWAARSAVKGVIYMTPAVPFFWITRTPQTKHRGSFIHPELGQLTHFEDVKEGRRGAIHANDLKYGSATVNEPYFYSQYDAKLHKTTGGPPYRRRSVSGSTIEPVRQGRNFDAYGQSHGGLDSSFNTVGKASYDFASSLDTPAAWADHHFGSAGNTIKQELGIKNFERFTRPMLHAAASYTPYMYAKAEFANLWDNGKMDMAAERMIDGAASLNWGEFSHGAHEVWDSIWHKPLADSAREAEAVRRTHIDRSPADTFTKTQSQMEDEVHESRAKRTEKQGLSWEERVISAPKAAIAPKEEKARPQKAASHTEQAAMRKKLEELTPPTNSIN